MLKSTGRQQRQTQPHKPVRKQQNPRDSHDRAYHVKEMRCNQDGQKLPAQPFRQLTHGNEIQKIIGTEDQKHQAQQIASDIATIFINCSLNFLLGM